MEHKISGTDVLLFIDPSGGTSYVPVVCLTNNSIKFSTNIVDASTKCGPDSLPGIQPPIAVTFEGQMIFDFDESTKVSSIDLFPLWSAKTTIGWKIAPAVPQPGDEIFTGTGFISDLSNTYAQNSPATFTGTLSAYGKPTQSKEGS